MWIAAKTDDALRSAVLLARAWPGHYVKADELAAAEGRPVRFLENVLADLRRAGLVTGRRGCCGGYALTRAPSLITALDVLHAIGSPVVDASPRQRCGDGVCAMWTSIDASTRASLASHTLEDLASYERGRQHDRARVVPTGGLATVPARQRHAVRNAGITPAVSVHVYSPPLGDDWRP